MWEMWNGVVFKGLSIEFVWPRSVHREPAQEAHLLNLLMLMRNSNANAEYPNDFPLLHAFLAPNVFAI